MTLRRYLIFTKCIIYVKIKQQKEITENTMKTECQIAKKTKITDTHVTMLLLVCTAIAVTITGILFHQSVLRILPLYISMFISLLQSRVNRYASLIGAFNSLLYAGVYIYYGLYASVLYAVLVSFPLQLVTFIRWNRNPYQKSTVFRKMTVKQRLITALIAIAFWCGMLIVLKSLGSSHQILDNTVTMLGILNTVLMMLSYIEYTALMIPGNLFSIALYIAMIKESPEQITYLIYTLFSGYCVVRAFFRARKLYAEQNKKI